MYDFSQLLMVCTIIILCPCSVIATIAGCLIWYKRWEARDFKPKEKNRVEKRFRDEEFGHLL